MRLWTAILLYAIIAVVAYVIIYYVFLQPPPTDGCVPTYYRPCP